MSNDHHSEEVLVESVRNQLQLGTPQQKGLSQQKNGYLVHNHAPSDVPNEQLHIHENNDIGNSSHGDQGERTKGDGGCLNTSEVASIVRDSKNSCLDGDDVTYVVYKNETQMPDIMKLIQKDLSEPYSIYTYRYFIHNWPHLCFMARVDDVCVGAIVCKLDFHKKVVKRGYIAMLAVDSQYRKKKIGSTLVRKAIEAMISEDADEVVLETEITNKPALRLYENLGFVRDKRLFRYYLNGVDALRLKLWLK